MVLVIYTVLLHVNSVSPAYRYFVIQSFEWIVSKQCVEILSAYGAARMTLPCAGVPKSPIHEGFPLFAITHCLKI